MRHGYKNMKEYITPHVDIILLSAESEFMVGSKPDTVPVEVTVEELSDGGDFWGDGLNVKSASNISFDFDESEDTIY